MSDGAPTMESRPERVNLEAEFHKRIKRLGLQGEGLSLTRRQQGYIMGAFREVLELNKEKQ